MVVKELIDKLYKCDMYTEVFVSINEEDGINIDNVVDEIHGVFIEITIKEEN